MHLTNQAIRSRHTTAGAPSLPTNASGPKGDCGVGSVATVVNHIAFRSPIARRESDLRSTPSQNPWGQTPTSRPGRSPALPAYSSSLLENDNVSKSGMGFVRSFERNRLSPNARRGRFSMWFTTVAPMNLHLPFIGHSLMCDLRHNRETACLRSVRVGFLVQ